MDDDEKLLVRVMYAMRELDFLKRLSGMVEMEKKKIGRALEDQLVQIKEMKDGLVRFVVSGRLDLQRTAEVQEVIRNLNTILDAETNRKTCVCLN